MQNRTVAKDRLSSGSAGTYPPPGGRLPAERLLVSAADLRQELEEGGPLTVLDVRWRLGGPPALSDYRTGHIPSAAFVDLDEDLAGPVRPPGGPGGQGPPGQVHPAKPGQPARPTGRHPMPDAASFGEAMRRAGVRAGVRVVCYDDRDSTTAARCWWLLTYFGHPSTSVLDGGLAAWLEASGPLEPGDGSPDRGDFVPEPGHLPLLVADDAARLAAAGVLLDARSPERYRGESEPVDRVAGHIPGAVSAPTADNVDSGGRFLPPEELAARFAGLGVRPGVPVGAYCGSGVTAAHEVLALELAGLAGAGLYVGSWSEWSETPGRPVATGPEAAGRGS